MLDKFVIRNCEGIAWRVIDSQAVIINSKENTFHTLNAVASRIWELAEGKATLKDIAEKIHQEFEVDLDEAERDCLEFVNQMIDKELIVLSFGPSEEDLHGRESV